MIHDDFTTMNVSKNRKYQLRNLEHGLCCKCTKKRAPGDPVFCAAHREYDRKRRGSKEWQPGGRGRKPKWYRDLELNNL